MSKKLYDDDYIEVCECARCGHRWIPRMKDPERCPRCKSYYWDDWEDEDE